MNGLWRWAPVVAQMAAIFVASSMTAVPDLPAGLSNHTGHFIGYAILGSLALRAFAGARWRGVTARAAGWSVLLSSAYGVTDELHQTLVPNRTPAVDDWAADTAGAVIAVLAVLILAHLIGRRRPRTRSV